MSDTPETDAAVDDAAFEDKNQVHTDWVTAFFSRKLERERDEAREKYFVMRDAHNNVAEIAGKYRRERDEAREALMEIEDRCVDCEDACNDIMKIREIAAKALEEAK